MFHLERRKDGRKGSMTEGRKEQKGGRKKGVGGRKREQEWKKEKQEYRVFHANTPITK